MKKYLISFIVMLCFVLSANADGTSSCKVQGTANGTVVASVHAVDKEKGTAAGTISNDTDRNVNVTYTIDFVTRGGVTSKSGTTIVRANDEKALSIPSLGKAFTEIHIRITGARCN